MELLASLKKRMKELVIEHVKQCPLVVDLGLNARNFLTSIMPNHEPRKILTKGIGRV